MSTRFLIRLGNVLWLMAAALTPLEAQLAITEVMSSASQHLGTNLVSQRSDFWELTNFGPDPIDLTEYRFSDDAGIEAAVDTIFAGVTIRAGESIIFAQVTVPVCTNAAQFRAWWGDTNVPTNRQVHFYDKHKFSSVRDAVQLWRVTTVSTTLVQRVELYEARQGSTFTYDLTTGVLDSFSTLDQQGVFKAVETDDVGSPGHTAVPVPLAIRQQPQGSTVDGGAPATFTVRASGLPPPRFQWCFNGAAIPGATSNVYTILAAQPADAGTYTVQVENGLETLVGTSAVLLVNTVSNPPSIVVPPADLMVTPGQEANFMVAVRGYPVPTFQWQFNGVELYGATNRTLRIVNVDFNSAGTYSVQVRNSLGSTNGAAVLSVRPKPLLVVTEAMGSHSTNGLASGHADWWELTNFDTNAVSLRGYRYDDFPGVPDGAVVVTNDVVIQPGESVLWIQDMTPAAFTRWWGEENLPENVQFIRYPGNGFQSDGDALYLWNATATDRYDLIASISFDFLAPPPNPDFLALRGFSKWFDPVEAEVGEFSVQGERGAIRSIESDDIGSPGYVTNHPLRTVAPRCLGVSRDAQGIHFDWKTQTGRNYELQYKTDFASPNWTPLSQHPNPGALLTTTDRTITGLAQRFYRLRVVSDPP